MGFCLAIDKEMIFRTLLNLYNMKKLFAILILVLCVAAFSDFDASARPRGPRGPRGPKARIGHCMKCGGSGRVKCTKCGGYGIISDGPHSWYGCQRCGGKGYCAIDHEFGNSNAITTPGYRKGSGRMKCPKCGGRGR